MKIGEKRGPDKKNGKKGMKLQNIEDKEKNGNSPPLPIILLIVYPSSITNMSGSLHPLLQVQIGKRGGAWGKNNNARLGQTSSGPHVG